VGEKRMKRLRSHRRAAMWAIAIGIIAAIAGILFLSETRLASNSEAWSVTGDGLLQYPLSLPECTLNLTENIGNYDVVFSSRGVKMAGLLRIPSPGLSGARNGSIPGIVLLPGATVTKEREQGLAKYLCGLGYASICFDQRNLGATDVQGDLQMFLQGKEPTEHKMVHDALAAAGVLRSLQEIDADRIVYLGESNGGRFAIIACALDARARGVVAISTCGYGTAEAIRTGELREAGLIRFYRSIDPETYLSQIPPRPLVMLHSTNDTVIPYEYAQQSYAEALPPKFLFTVGCAKHGYCQEMNVYLEKELKEMTRLRP
jgi:dienelactone hydrolase